MKYQHSVSLDVTKCKGCTTCLKRCPTEAIRIRNGHAVISAARCIDCGECIKVCPYKAKKATHDSLEALEKYKYTIALPAPALYGQFDNLDNIGYVISGLLAMGFDDVFEVAKAAELVSAYTRMYLKRDDVPKPVISSACPAITRIISMNYPFLCENVIPLLPPVEIAARLAREKAMKEHPELKSEEIGVVFISPCPAKVSYVKNGYAGESNNIDEVISVRDVYFILIDQMKHLTEDQVEFTEAGMIGIGWASTGGEASAVFNDRYLATDGIEECIRVLEQIDNEGFNNLDYVELNACSGGCVGGAMTVANPYIAQARLQHLKRYLPVSPNRPDQENIPNHAYVTEPIEYNPYNALSDNREEARQMLSEIQSICTGLPGLDCGSCGAPTCMAFAEDIVKGEINADECTVIMRMLFHEYLEQHKDKALLEGLKPLTPTKHGAPEKETATSENTENANRM